ncbi:MAG: UTP--glucose-1-phosphate uridylyltransferase [Rubritalea sp.]|uniref:UTP--glucose-1-phosphate uridylyltransferase n=1 Tax=Rubritalea sp. TaxID=2109375 RepID=UPI003241E77D
MSSFTPFRTKMEQAGVSEAAILSFQRNYEILACGSSTDITEASIEPVEKLPELEEISQDGEAFSAELLAKTVVIKLNGGLGTSMGLQKAKSLLEVKDGSTFLDIIVDQISYLRNTTGAQVKFLLMNSFSTSEDTLDHLAQYPDESLSAKAQVELHQNQIPKIDAKTMEPVDYPANSNLEWCPPGHGDIYPAIAGSGWLDKLLSEGVKYAFVSNSDNLGAVLHPGILRYFAESGKPFLMEATRRTEADKKGGHLAIRKEDGQLLLREVAQCPDSDLGEFQNIAKHQYFNTNSLWVNLESLKSELDAKGGVLPLPVIINNKTVDPRDKSSKSVYQLETAMGAAIECFKGADAICVPRSRFAPVKTTADLFTLRSDAYETTEDGRIALVKEREGKPPVVRLSDEYKLVDSLEGLGVPSLKRAAELSLKGPVRFADMVEIRGTVSISNEKSDTSWIANGIYKDEDVVL